MHQSQGFKPEKRGHMSRHEWESLATNVAAVSGWGDSPISAEGQNRPRLRPFQLLLSEATKLQSGSTPPSHPRLPSHRPATEAAVDRHWRNTTERGDHGPSYSS